MSGSQIEQLRVLALASRFYMDHLDHLAVLAQHCELTIAMNTEREAGTVARAASEGLPVTSIGSIGLQKIEARLAKLVEQVRPTVVYTLWDTNEELTLIARRVVADDVIVVHKCSDPLTTLFGMATSFHGHQPAYLEREALRASDGQIFVTKAIRTYLEQTHDLDLEANSLIVPHAKSEQTIGPSPTKLSTQDGQVHIALVGFAHSDPNHGRFYGNIIRRLIAHGFVVHSHFHEVKGVSNKVYRDLADEFPNYHYHATLPNREGTLLSEVIARYDLMGVFHEVGAPMFNESEVLRVCMPSKAVCGWIHGAIPVVSFADYQGVAEVIDELGVGFVIRRWEDLATIAADRDAIARATAACLQHRHRFTHEWNAQRIVDFFRRLSAEKATAAA